MAKKKKADFILNSDGSITINEENIAPKVYTNDIAPVRTSKVTEAEKAYKDALLSGASDFTVQTRLNSLNQAKKDEKDGRKWFREAEGSTFDKILGTGTKFAEKGTEAILGMGEAAVDAFAWLAPIYNAGQTVQNGGNFDIDTYRKQQEYSEDFIKKDLYSEENIARKIITEPAKKIGIDADKSSILGERSEDLIKSAGQLGATFALQAGGIPWFLTTGVTSFGFETENAFEQGASYEEAGASALITAGADIFTEKLSGGIKFGGKTVDEALIRRLGEKITDKTYRTLAKIGVDMVGEGAEEILASVISNLGTKAYKDESVRALLFSEEARDEYLESFIGGAVLGGTISGASALRNKKTGRDYVTGLTDNEQKVVNSEITNRTTEIQKQRAVEQQINRVIEERERTFGTLNDTEKRNIKKQIQERLDNGELDYSTAELSKKELKEIESQVLEDLKYGNVSIDTIEDALVGDKTAHLKELEQTLTNTTDEAKKAEIKAEINQIKLDKATQLKDLLGKDVILQESYRQESLKKQEFDREVAETDSDITKELLESAKASKMNNTRKMHNLFEYTNKIANDTGTKYGFVNNDQLKELGYDVEGKTVNGLVRVSEDGSAKVLINVDSDKALNTIIGHETTHLLEGTNEYKALQDIVKEYATTKGEYDSRFKEISKLYEDTNANVESEVTADLVGDYLFTDEQFINNLSAKQPNVFQRVYDYIKHVYKMATAGSKEARQLEQVKRRFDKAYKEMSKTTTGKVDSNLATEADSDIKYSFAGVNSGTADLSLKDRAVEMRNQGVSPEEIWEETGWKYGNDHKWRYEIDDSKAVVRPSGDADLLSDPDYKRMNELFQKFMSARMTKEEANEYTALSKKFEGRKTKVLSHILSHDSLYAAYPQLKNVGIVVVKEGPGVGRANYNKDTNTISIREDVYRRADELRKTLLHETQHAIQSIEEFERGGNKESALDVVRLEFARFLEKIMPAETDEAYKKDKAEGGDRHSLALVDDFIKKYYNLDKIDENVKREFYMNLMGEKEARAVTERMNFSDAERREAYPNYDRGAFRRGEYDNESREGVSFDYETYSSEILPIKDLSSGVYENSQSDPKRFVQSKSKQNSRQQLRGIEAEVPNKGAFFDAEKTQFSLSAPVEETKDLMAIHNLHVNEVLKQLDLGGMPMPSVAITDPSIVDHEGFGDVTLILNKDAIDPKKSKLNKVYSNDAYTPTFPQIHYEADEKVAEHIADKVRSLIDQIPSGFQGDLRRLRYSSEIDDVLNSEGGQQGLIDRVRNTYGMKELYLAEKGEAVPLETKRTEVPIDEAKKELYDFIIGKMGSEAVSLSAGKGLTGRQWFDQYGEQIKKTYYDFFVEGGSTVEQTNKFIESQKPVYFVSKVREAARYLENGGVEVQESLDYGKAQNIIDEKIKGSDYDTWLNNLFNGIEGTAGIRNKKELFTPSGNRRSFKQLYDPVTLDNIVKAMRGDAQQKGQAAFGGSMFGASAKEYKSIKEIKADSNRLGRLEKAETEEYKTYIQETIDDIAHRYANGKDWWDARNALIEAVGQSETKAGITKYLKEFDYVYKLDESIVDDLIELRDYVRGLTVPYFEAKPQRAVGFDEVGVFVIPNNADATLKQKLLEAGYAIAEYNPEIEGDRQNVVNRFEEYKFSLSKPGEDIAPIGNYNVYGKDVKLQEDIAPVKETISKTETVEDVAPVREDLQLSRALTEDDLPYVEQDREDAFDNLPVYEPEEIEYYNEPDTAPLDDKYLRLVAKNMRQELGLKNNQVAGLRKIIQDFSTSEDQSLESLYNAIETEFGTIYEKQKIEDVTGIKAALRSTRLKVSDTIKTDIPDYAKWRQKQFGTLKIANDGMAVDDVYEGLKDIYPKYFPDDIINPTDQLLKIAEIASMDATVIEEYSLPEEQIQEVADYIYESITEYKQQKRFEAAQTASKAPIDESMIPYEETILETPIPEDAAPVEKEAEAEQETEEAPLIAKTRKEIRKALLEDDQDIIIRAMENAKNLSSPLMNNTDTIRLSEMVFGRAAGKKINDLIFQKVLDNEAKSVSWQNEQRKAIKDLGIKARSKESAAVQKWGEGEYVNQFGDVIEYTDSDLILEFPDVETQKKIKNAAIEIRKRYDEYIDVSNQVLTGLGFKPIEKRKNYFMHFQELGDFFSKNGIPFNPQSMAENNLPTDINGLTEFFVPQKKYFASMNRREGKRTVYDAITGIDKYISGVADLIYHTEDIQRGRAFEELIRDTYGQNDTANATRDALPEELRFERLEKQQTAHLSKYVRWLHNWTDGLAGKKNRIDRAIEDFGDRAGFSVLDTARKQVSANMIGFNPASALTNVIASVQAISKTDKVAVAKGTADTIRNIIQKDDFVSKNSFLINRFGTDMLSKNKWQQIQDAGFVFMKGMDWFSSNQIVRSKFYELKAQGMTDTEAHAEAGKFAARIMGDRTKGANAMFYNSKLFNVIGQFQLEVNNQLYSIFYDTYQESKEKANENALKTAAGMTFTLGQMFAFTHLFGKTFESVAGYNPTFDVFGIIATALGLGDDEEDDVVDNLQEAAEQLLKALPYSSLFTDGGRIPLSSGIPNIPGLITGAKDSYGNELDFGKEMAKLPYLLLPAGYGQIKKTSQGLGMFDDDLPVTGSYTDSGNLRFPVEATPLNVLQAGVFGQWSSENARNYFNNERKPLGEKQIQEYKDLDIPIADYWKYREDLKGKKKLEDKFDYIADLDLPVSKKNIMINNIVDRKEAADKTNYDQFGSYEEFDWAYENPEKYSYLESIGVSYKQYSASKESKEAYNWAYNNPEKYSLAKAAAGDVVKYRSYTSDLNDITADKDSSGKSISGSRKTKVANYINGLDADYGSKLILFKSEYPADDTYNYEIIEYLNNRQDISYAEMVSILTELDFTVDANGNVTW